MDTSGVSKIEYMFWNCTSLKNFNPLNFPFFDFSVLPHLKEDYPECFIWF